MWSIGRITVLICSIRRFKWNLNASFCVHSAAANLPCRDSLTSNSGSNEAQKAPNVSPSPSHHSSPIIEAESQGTVSSDTQVTISKPAVLNLSATSEVSGDPTNPTSSTGSTLAEEYEQCYQEYYKHYYTHCYTQFTEQQSKLLGPSYSFNENQRSAVVQQAAKAAAVAASAAVNAMYQAGIKRKMQEETTSV